MQRKLVVIDRRLRREHRHRFKTGRKFVVIDRGNLFCKLLGKYVVIDIQARFFGFRDLIYDLVCNFVIINGLLFGKYRHCFNESRKLIIVNGRNFLRNFLSKFFVIDLFAFHRFISFRDLINYLIGKGIIVEFNRVLHQSRSRSYTLGKIVIIDRRHFLGKLFGKQLVIGTRYFFGKFLDKLIVIGARHFLRHFIRKQIVIDLQRFKRHFIRDQIVVDRLRLAALATVCNAIGISEFARGHFRSKLFDDRFVFGIFVRRHVYGNIVVCDFFRHFGSNQIVINKGNCVRHLIGNRILIRLRNCRHHFFDDRILIRLRDHIRNTVGKLVIVHFGNDDGDLFRKQIVIDFEGFSVGGNTSLSAVSFFRDRFGKNISQTVAKFVVVDRRNFLRKSFGKQFVIDFGSFPLFSFRRFRAVRIHNGKRVQHFLFQTAHLRFNTLVEIVCDSVETVKISVFRSFCRFARFCDFVLDRFKIFGKIVCVEHRHTDLRDRVEQLFFERADLRIEVRVEVLHRRRKFFGISFFKRFVLCNFRTLFSGFRIETGNCAKKFGSESIQLALHTNIHGVDRSLQLKRIFFPQRLVVVLASGNLLL